MFDRSPPFPSTPPMAGYWPALKRGTTPALLLEIGLALWLLLLVVSPIVVFHVMPEHYMERLFIEEHGHLLIECFCGFVALMIAAMLLTTSLNRRRLSIALFGLGFLAMGVLDILHAWSDPFHDTQRFVLYHTLSTLLGGAFILAGVIASAVRGRGLVFSRADAVTALVGLALIVGIAVLYRAYLPTLIPADTGRFGISPNTHGAHYLAGLFYAISALAFYRFFRRHGKLLALVIASLMVLFAQSAYLFSFSNLWDLTWWMWHAVKVFFYLGIMVTVFASYLFALRTIEESRRGLTQANQKLQASRRAIGRINQELKIRNRMAREAMSSLDLDHVLDVVSKSIHQLLGFSSCELILLIPADEVDEFERRASRISERWPVRAQRADISCFGGACKAVRSTHGQLFECGRRDGSDSHSICLSLRASDREIGHLRLLVDDPEALRHGVNQLQALAAEVGSIINNALLHHDRLEANAFRLALLRVSSMLTSTLDLDRVLQSVCKESAALLESDGALVWLPGSQPGTFSLAARWFGHSDARKLIEIDDWCSDGRHCSNLLESIGGEFIPRAILWHDDTNGAAFIRPANCPWEALALFPLKDGESLIGVMVLVRLDRVRYSAATLAKGELLAGQVRIAINNARSYARLAEFNQQLKLAEEDKIRAERMAALGQMAASVAHEVRNPLSAISNCLAVLKVGAAADARSQAALDIIQEEVGRLTNLTTNFLTFGNPHPHASKPVVLEGLLRKVCLALERHIAQEEQAIQVELDLPPIPTHLLFDGEGLETVLWNLLLNASQAIHGPGRIRVALRSRPAYFLLAVADTGKGIAPGERAKVFDPFFSSRSLGAGLGLAIVQRYVSGWGGRIRLSSVPGRGTTFYLRVPVVLDEQLSSRSPGRPKNDLAPTGGGSAFDAEPGAQLTVRRVA